MDTEFVDMKKVEHLHEFSLHVDWRCTYILPDIIFYLTGLLGVSLLPDNLSYGWPGILWSAFFAVVVMYIVILLNKIHLQLKL